MLFLRFLSRCCRTLTLTLIGAAVVCPSPQAFAHHDGGTQLPVSLNVPGTAGGLSPSAPMPETRLSLSSRAFRVSDHPLYSASIGGDATVLLNALSASMGVAQQAAIEAVVPMITDLPEGTDGGNTGLGDVQLGFRWFALAQPEELALSLAAETSLPTGSASRGFGADAFVSRASTRLSHGLARNNLRVLAEAGVAWAWADRRGTMADVALASLWQATRVVGVFFEARVLTALEAGRQQPVNFGGRARQAGDTSVVLTPAITCLLSDHLTAAMGPQLPLGFADFDVGLALSVTYRQ